MAAQDCSQLGAGPVGGQTKHIYYICLMGDVENMKAKLQHETFFSALLIL